MGSRIFDWEKLAVTATKSGERRDFFDTATATLRHCECHATTLNAGEAAHPPHRHPEEEMIVVKEGTLEVAINGAPQQAGAGSVFFFASGDLHGVRNTGAMRATYFVFRLFTADTPAAGGAR